MKDLPIACSLDAPGLGERRRAWENLIDAALRHSARTPSGIRLAFASAPSVERRLEELVELERQCCGFAQWKITCDAEHVVLSVTGDPDGAAAIQELFRC